MTMAVAIAAAVAAAACQPGAAVNRQIVSDFYALALIEKQPVAAFEKYAALDFVEHKPDVPTGTREAAAAFLDQLIRSMPAATWEVLRVMADGDLVALHARFVPAPGAPQYAIADFFRLRDCRIVEHWDVVAGPPKDAPNPNPRF